MFINKWLFKGIVYYFRWDFRLFFGERWWKEKDDLKFREVERQVEVFFFLQIWDMIDMGYEFFFRCRYGIRQIWDMLGSSRCRGFIIIVLSRLF